MPEISVPSPPEIFGLKVASVSASMGWGGQGGTCTLSLIDEGTAPTLPNNGTACGFTFGNFSFGGHLQRWTYKESLSGRFYDVSLESPSKLLDGVQVILTDFERGYSENSGPATQHPTQEVRNVWNVLAEWDSFFHGGTFGDADTNSAGIPITTLFPKLIDFGLGNGTHGGVFGTKIKFGESEYTIDFSELFNEVTSRAPFYRVKGPVQSLNGILADLAEVAQVDYFVQCEATALGKIDRPNLRVRIADRSTVASGVIDAYITGKKGSGTVVSANTGRELQDVATAKVLIGGAASKYHEAFIVSDITAMSVWGQIGNNAEYVLGGPVPTEYVTNNLDGTVSVIKDEFNPADRYTATMFELRMALGGQQTWQTFKVFQMLAGVEPNGHTTADGLFHGAIEANQTTIDLLFEGKRDAIDMAPTKGESADDSYTADLKKQEQELFAAVSKVATTFYGQVFMISLPEEPGGLDNNLRFINEDVQYQASWEIAESAWTTTKPIPDWNFYDGEGKLKSYALFKALADIDYSPLGGDYAIGQNGGLATTKGGPDKDIFWYDGHPHVIVRTGVQLREYDSLTTPDFGLGVLAKHFFNKDVTPDKYIGPGKQSVQISIPPAVVVPNTIGVPMESTRYSWGPWWGFSVGFFDNTVGKTEVEVDTSMRPETFGSLATMDNVGFGSVTNGLARLAAVESGSIELAEAPDFNMGDRFSAGGPYVTSMDISIGVDGYKTNYKFSTWTPDFGKLSKYNADRLSRINKASIAMAKSERSKVNKRPFPKMKFEKTDFSAKMANGGQRFDNRFGMEVFNGMFRSL
jgi:hypothetical protein